MPTDIVVKHFEGRPVPFRVESGKLTLTMRETGELLGYKSPDTAISKLFSTHQDEFDNDCTWISQIGHPGEIAYKRERLFSLDGLILFCMFSEQPVAKKVRKWLRKIGREVAETGSYNSPALAKILDGFNETLLLQGRMIQNQQAALADMQARFSQVLIPANRDNTTWLTATQRIKQLIPCSEIPKHFNSGGHFDQKAAEEHYREFSAYPSPRSRRFIQKNPEWVFEPCPEMDDFLRRYFKKYMACEWPPGKQRNMKLSIVPLRHPKETLLPARKFNRRGRRIMD